MRFDRVKKDRQLALDGIKIETEYHDNSLQSVTFSDGKGGVVRVALESYNLYALVPAKPVMVKRHKLHGTVAGLPVELFFENTYDAERAKSHYEGRVMASNDAVLDIEPVEVPEDTAEPPTEFTF